MHVTKVIGTCIYLGFFCVCLKTRLRGRGECMCMEVWDMYTEESLLVSDISW